MGSWDFREEEEGFRRGKHCSTNPKNIKEKVITNSLSVNKQHSTLGKIVISSLKQNVVLLGALTPFKYKDIVFHLFITFFLLLFTFHFYYYLLFFILSLFISHFFSFSFTISLSLYLCCSPSFPRSPSFSLILLLLLPFFLC
jgi:hypothetical protein